MNALSAIGEFLYDFLVGDSWPLTLAMVVVLALGVAAARLLSAPPAVLAVLLALAAASAACLTVLVEARRGLRGR